MAKKKNTSPPVKDISAPVSTAQADATTSQPSPKDRADQCIAEIGRALQAHRCRMVATINPPKPVGAIGNGIVEEVQISARCVVVPE